MSILTLDEVLDRLTIEPKPDLMEKHPFLGQSIGKCTFQGQIICLADFEGAEFCEDVSFRGVVFRKGASFIGTIFHCKADFTEAVFECQAFFWKCSFLGVASFERCNVKVENHPDGRRFPGETNFSYSIFHKAANFTRLHCQGPAFFHRTYFKDIANFEESRFDDYVKFEGSKSDICLTEKELQSNALIKILEDGGVIKPNTDHPPGRGGVGFYNWNSAIEDIELLESSLGKGRDKVYKLPRGEFIWHLKPRKVKSNDSFIITTPVVLPSPETVSLIVKLFRDHSISMFEGKGENSALFVRTEFRSGAIFAELDLSHVRFQQTSLREVLFSTVSWCKRPLPFRLQLGRRKIFGYRNGLHDEAQLAGKNSRIFLERTCHDIRLGYQNRGAIDLARDFYYAELELRYKSQDNWLLRKLSLAFLYKYGSGFGRQQGLAGLWLLFFTIVLFPLMWAFAVWLKSPPLHGYMVPSSAGLISPSPGKSFWTLFGGGLIRSLEACTFISAAPTTVSGVSTAPSTLERVIAGVERIVVAVQLTLFILATKWQFERNPGSS